MATMKIRWTVSDLVNVMSLYDVQRVWRATTLDPANWVEITSVATRVPLVALQEAYLFDDITGSTAYYYAVSYYNSVTTLHSNLSDPMRADLSGYVTVQDVRDEGFTDTMVTDADIVRGSERATSIIDKVTRQWFEPRTRTFHLDGKRGQDLLIDVPIIAITSVGIVDYRGEIEDIPLTDLWVYNRHLTQGLLNPDDRHNPRISWRDLLPSSVNSQRSTARFVAGRRNIQIVGVFGYTELGDLVVPGETVAGSQIPSDYGDIPEMIKLAALLLTIRHMFPRASGDGEAFLVRNRILEEKTRDQSYKLGRTSEEDNAFGITGDIEVDKILGMYMAPLAAGVI